MRRPQWFSVSRIHPDFTAGGKQLLARRLEKCGKSRSEFASDDGRFGKRSWRVDEHLRGRDLGELIWFVRGAIWSQATQQSFENVLRWQSLLLAGISQRLTAAAIVDSQFSKHGKCFGMLDDPIGDRRIEVVFRHENSIRPRGGWVSDRNGVKYLI